MGHLPSALNLPSRSEVAGLRRKVIHWFKLHGRRYPWRESSDPYRILIAEMMLRRTRADQVVPVYEAFLKRFPGIQELASASLEEVRTLLEPLGLHWRVPAFIEMARKVVEEYNGRIPQSLQELLLLPGVGEYVAGALLVLAWQKQEWVVDSNIARVFCRYFGIQARGEARRDRSVIEVARMYLRCRKPALALLGLLDLAALLCLPRKPSCSSCPLRRRCHFFIAEAVAGTSGAS